MVTLTYYPGCSLKTSSKFYETSIREVFSFYGIDIKELDDWSYCGASVAHTVDEMLAHVLAARNIAIAEADGNPVFVPCSACYSRSKITNDKIIKDKGLRDKVNEYIYPLRCLGTTEIKNIIEIFSEHVGIEKIAKGLSFDLSSIKVVPYYGCMLTRIPKTDVFDDCEDPLSMDTLLWAAGTEVLRWPFKIECCGASETITNKNVTSSLSGKITDMACAVGADAIITTCPLCQMNLDLLPHLGRKTDNIPVLFLTEVFELAIKGKIIGKGSHIIPVDQVIKKPIRRLKTQTQH